MRFIQYIEFPSGWRPPTHRGIEIEFIRDLFPQESKNGHTYYIKLGKITDEDAIVLRLKDPNAKITKKAPK